MNKLVLQVSKLLAKRKIYHRVRNEFIITRKSKVKIPNISKDIAYLVGVITGDGYMSMSKRNRGGYHYRVGI